MTWIGEGRSYLVKSGERIAQLVIAPIPEVKFSEVKIDDLGKTERGEGIWEYREILTVEKTYRFID